MEPTAISRSGCAGQCSRGAAIQGECRWNIDPVAVSALTVQIQRSTAGQSGAARNVGTDPTRRVGPIGSQCKGASAVKGVGVCRCEMKRSKRSVGGLGIGVDDLIK